MTTLNEITVKAGLRKWVPVAVFLGWLVYYSLPFAAWRNAFAEWLAEHVSKRGVWVR